MIAITHLRILVAGVAARVWRLLTGGPCPCEWCTTRPPIIATADPDTRAEARSRRGV